MPVFVVVVPQTVAKGAGPGGRDVIRPDFGSMEKTLDDRGWGQASSAWHGKGSVAVWVRCDSAEADALAKEVGGTVVGETKPVDEAKGDTLAVCYREKVMAAETAVMAEIAAAPIVDVQIGEVAGGVE